MAQYAPDPGDTFDVPDGLDDGVAVALGIAGLAAWLPLTFHAQLQPGESVLVLGASGVVGQIAAQAAKLLGAGRVVAAARSRPVLERLRERGAADEIAVLEGDLVQALKGAAPDGYDVIVDPLYGQPLEAALQVARPNARIVVVGAAAGTEATIPIIALYGRRIISHSNGQVPVDVRREAYATMARHALAGEIAVDVERLPLSDIQRAWQEQASGPHHKIALIP
jgi:NADPH2:quinone reductase